MRNLLDCLLALNVLKVIIVIALQQHLLDVNSVNTPLKELALVLIALLDFIAMTKKFHHLLSALKAFTLTASQPIVLHALKVMIAKIGKH